MRNITTITNQILSILGGATIAPGDQDNITTLSAELRVLLRRASYAPPESVEGLWISLGTSLYRYLPPVQSTGYTAQIAAIATGA
jgi:hypothetical protein